MCKYFYCGKILMSNYKAAEPNAKQRCCSRKFLSSIADTKYFSGSDALGSFDLDFGSLSERDISSNRF